MSVYSVIAGAAVSLPLVDAHAPLQVDVFAALAAHTIIAAGRAQSPWTPQTSLGVALVPSGGVQLVWRVSRPVRVSLYGELGASVSPVVIAIAARDVGRYGEPFVGFGGGVGFEL